MPENDITEIILKYSFKIHTALGPGLLESVYTECLFYELVKAGLFVEKQKVLPVVYETITLETGFRIDLFVEGKVIVELKAVEALDQIHLAQTLTYLRLSNCKVGLLINFNVMSLKAGIRSVVNNFQS
ncbi:GxxExxY protein [Dyadobacter sp. LHD-138]|uniref:GxxExxY protein n=1 Tax=Dyadobacter sp. LHD-138 TaxID=3071413 RepID=UPI0027DED248|nr:GxxExxY protein [Dyadobacter sp. LHD-138]MDQ6478589.1 GxxExxY protein [Dyadobacter sp. LHD-138]